LEFQLMKTCAYCGRGNDDRAPHCCECGTSAFRSAEPKPPAKVAQPTAFPKFELRQLSAEERTQAFAVIHNSMVAEEAEVLVSRLIAAGIHASIANNALTETFSGSVNTRDFIRVQVPTKEFDAACELLAADAQAAIEANRSAPEPVSEKADLPLDTSMKCLMFVLPFACLSLFIAPFITRHYTQNGYTRRAAEGGRTFLCGTLSAIVLYLILFLTRR
jgi:hypothetical protein